MSAEPDGKWALECQGGAHTPQFRRLTARDILSSLEDALGLDALAWTVAGAPWPTLRLGSRNSPGTSDLEWLLAIAREYAREYAAAHADECSDADACSARLEELGLGLFRRPLHTEELASFQELFESVQADSDDQTALDAVVQAMILSPHFTFRIETTVPTPAGPRWSPYTLAARLAYFLWRSGPDAELLEAAADETAAAGDAASDVDFVYEQTQRMLDDPRARAGFDAVVREWFRISVPVLPPMDAPPLAPIEAMDRQTSEFLDALWTEEQASLRELLLASWSPLNAELAEHYGVPSDGLGSAFTRVELDPDRFSGILTHGSFLVSSRTPSTRGLHLLQNVLCVEFPASIADKSLPPGNTRRERYEAISSDGLACRTCHEHLDPLGFALEGFDHLGAPQDSPSDGFVRELDNEEYRRFNGPRELAKLLAESHQVSQCVVRQFLEYALDGVPDRQILLQSGAPNPAPPSEPPPPEPPGTCLGDAFFFTQTGDLRNLMAGLPLSAPFRRPDRALELPVFRSSARTALEHAAQTAAFLVDAAPMTPGNPEMRSYAERLAALSTEEAP